MRDAGRIVTIVMVLALVSVTCGDDDLLGDPPGTAPTDTAATGTETTLPFGVGGDDDAPATTSSEPSLLCEDEITEVGLGTPLAAENSEARPTVCFWVEVPEGLDSVTFSVTDLNADLTLGVGYGFLRTVQFNVDPFWDAREEGPVDEAITLESPAGGPYFITVALGERDGFTPFTLTVVTTPEMTAAPGGGPTPAYRECRPPATELSIGDTAQGEITEAEAQPDDSGRPPHRDFWCVEVPDGLPMLTVSLTEYTAGVELRVSTPGETRLWSGLVGGGDEQVAEVEGPAAGIYLIEVSAGQRQATPYTITIG